MLSVLTAAILLLGVFPLPAASANAPAAAFPVAVSLVDDNGATLAGVKLSAKHAGSDRVQDSGKPGESGRILMSLPPGRYYFTGDVSVLNVRPAYSANFKIRQKMMFYYISESLDITENTGDITLKINSANYFDVADIGGEKNFSLHVTQSELGINATIRVRGSSNGVRLFLPMHKQYTFANLEAILHLKWPVYVTPGLQFVFSAS